MKIDFKKTINVPNLVDKYAENYFVIEDEFNIAIKSFNGVQSLTVVKDLPYILGNFGTIEDRSIDKLYFYPKQEISVLTTDFKKGFIKVESKEQFKTILNLEILVIDMRLSGLKLIPETQNLFTNADNTRIVKFNDKTIFIRVDHFSKLVRYKFNDNTWYKIVEGKLVESNDKPRQEFDSNICYGFYIADNKPVPLNGFGYIN